MTLDDLSGKGEKREQTPGNLETVERQLDEAISALEKTPEVKGWLAIDAAHKALHTSFETLAAQDRKMVGSSMRLYLALRRLKQQVTEARRDV